MNTERRWQCIRAAVVASVCLWALASMAQAAMLSLEQALGRAESANFSLDALQQRQLEAQQGVAGAAALPDPRVRGAYFGESVETRTGPQEALYSISQTVPWLQKLGTREALAASEAQSWAFMYQQALLALRRDVTTAYSEAVYQDQAVQSTEVNLKLIAGMRSIVEERVRGGASLNALLRIELEIERMRDELEKYKLARFTKRTQLAALLSVEESSLGDLTAVSTVAAALPSALALQAALQAQNPELLALQQRTVSASQRVNLRRLDRFPDFTFGIHYIQIGDNGSAAPDAGQDAWNVSMSVNLPIWPAKNRAGIQSAKAAQRAARQVYHGRFMQLSAALSATLARRGDSVRRIQRYQQTLIPLAEQALQNSRSAYESDQLSVLELIDSERALLELQLDAARAVANVIQADAAIDALIGRIN
jgi:cobalt-zinc-cadmium efflux system outer membrane protein